MVLLLESVRFHQLATQSSLSRLLDMHAHDQPQLSDRYRAILFAGQYDLDLSAIFDFQYTDTSICEAIRRNRVAQQVLVPWKLPMPLFQIASCRLSRTQ